MEYGYILIETTFAEKTDAEKIAKLLLDKNLIACGHFYEITSIYNWKGKAHQENEVLLRVKTKAILFGDCEKLIKKHHPYELPQIVATRIELGSEEFTNWLNESIKI